MAEGLRNLNPSKCWRYLFSRFVSKQVSSAQVSLTSVFGMGTGGPSLQSTPTQDASTPSKPNKVTSACFASACMSSRTILGQALGLLVPVSSIHYCTSTSGLSTSSSTTCLTPQGMRDLILGKVSRLDAFSVYLVRT